MLKVTVLYGHLENLDSFEQSYAATHLPIARAIGGVTMPMGAVDPGWAA